MSQDSPEKENQCDILERCGEIYFLKQYIKYIKRGIYFQDLAYLWGLANPKNLGPTDRLELFGVSPLLRSQVCRITGRLEAQVGLDVAVFEYRICKADWNLR